MPDLTVAASAARALIEFAASRGADRSRLLAKSGITDSDLADRDNRIAFRKYVALMRAAKDLCGDPAFALHFGETVDMSEISFAHQIGARSMMEALAVINRYASLTVEVDQDGSDRYTMSRVGGQLWMIDTRANANEFPELTESSFARMICWPRRVMGDTKLLKAVHVTHPAPSYRDEYERIFRVPVVFSSDRNALLLDEAALSFKPPVAPAYASDVLKTRAEELLTRLEQSKSTRAQVEKILVHALKTGDVSMQSTASELGLSRQTLFRKLKAEGVTFEKVLDDLRHRLALHYLNGGKMSVSQTAHLTGFSDPASFSRAFKRWTGSSPKNAAKAAAN